MEFPLTWGEFAWAAVVMWAASTVQGAVGFGLALIAAPLFLTTTPMLVPGPIIFVSLGLMVLVVVRDFESIDGRGVRWTAVGRIPGTAAAGLLLAWLPPEPFGILFGCLILLAVALSVLGLRAPLNRGTMLAAGAMSGVMGTISSVGGPPVALLYQHAPPGVIRGTIGANFVIGGVLSLVALTAAGRFGAPEFAASAALFPCGLAGFFCSRYLIAWMNPAWVRSAVLWFAAGSALFAMARQLW